MTTDPRIDQISAARREWLNTNQPCENIDRHEGRLTHEYVHEFSRRLAIEYIFRIDDEDCPIDIIQTIATAMYDPATLATGINVDRNMTLIMCALLDNVADILAPTFSTVAATTGTRLIDGDGTEKLMRTWATE